MNNLLVKPLVHVTATATAALLIWSTANAAIAPRVRTGSGGRVEVSRAVIKRSHLDTGSETNDSSRIFVRKLGCFQDQAGHVIASRLGGSGTDTKNLFPQEPALNNGAYKIWEDKIYNMVKDVAKNPRGVAVTITMSYGSPGKPNRPKKITYAIRYGKGLKKSDKRVFDNPLPSCCL